MAGYSVVMNILVNMQEYLEKDLKNTLKPVLPFCEHSNITDHCTSVENFSLVGIEARSLTRTIKEAVFVRLKDPSLNRYTSKYQVPHIWDEGQYLRTQAKLYNPSTAPCASPCLLSNKGTQ